ncbi:MAG: glycoside hydrolase family 15 protein, partial [Candidatus Rokubacteria bacterium]|nr:glycoside hydrolase family 15 protein [Candidatus Rokubacteria bacterium]
LTVDASLSGCFAFGAYDAGDPKVVKTMQAVADTLQIRTPVGGVARYQGDRYQAVEPASAAVPGNPWFICTLWLAQHHIARATTLEELQPARELLEWVAAHALPSGVLAEQIHPREGAPLSVSPLAWSHAEYVIAYLDYTRKFLGFTACPECGRPHQRSDTARRSSPSDCLPDPFTRI